MALLDQARLEDEEAIALGLSPAVAALLRLHWPLIKQLVGQQLWRLWWVYRNERLKAEWWIIRPSIKVIKLRKWMEFAFGPPPDDVAKLIRGEA